MFRKCILICSLLVCILNKNSASFEAFTQPQGILFLCPYISFGWKNSPYTDGRSGYQYNDKDKITSLYQGLFLEYGLTKKITLGFDTYVAEMWTSKTGKIAGKPQDKAFSLDWLSIFGRYNFIEYGNFFMSVYTALNFPKFGRGTGRFDTFSRSTGNYRRWQNLWRLETGLKFEGGHYITINIGYQANYGYTYDIAEFKVTNLLKFPYGFMLYSFFKKQAYITKGNELYAFAQQRMFNLDAFDFVTNGGYTSFGVYFGKKIMNKPSVSVVIAYTRSLNSVIFQNKTMNINSNMFWFEFWIFV